MLGILSNDFLKNYNILSFVTDYGSTSSNAVMIFVIFCYDDFTNSAGRRGYFIIDFVYKEVVGLVYLIVVVLLEVFSVLFYSMSLFCFVDLLSLVVVVLVEGLSTTLTSAVSVG